MPRISSRRGFTAVEILVVVGVLSMLTALIALGLIQLRNATALRVGTEDVWLTLRGARTATLASENDSVYGVRVEAGQVIQFKGATYVTGASTNIIMSLPSGVVAVPTFAHGGSQVVFTRLTGEPSATGTIMLTDQRSLATSSVDILVSGIIERSL